MNQIAVYGGSFNPPTVAHERLVETVLTKSKVEHIILCPSGDRLDKDHGIEHKHRERLLDLFFDTLRDRGLDVSLDKHFFHHKNGGHTTTVQEEAYFKARLGFLPYFIYGADIAENMPSWSGNKDRFIEKILRKIFIKRPGYDFCPDEIGLENYIFIDENMPDISSSLVREVLRNRQKVSDLINKDIENYIRENNLYSK